MTDFDEPREDTDAPPGFFDLDDGDEGSPPAHSWLGAVGQMIAAVLVVVAFVALFIVAAVALRRLFP